MHPQLQAVVQQFEAATARLHALAAQLTDDEWPRRPDPARWSVGECVAHLNLTALAYLPLLDEALARARASGEKAPRRYRRDPVGWLVWEISGPPARVRTTTAPAFVPTATRPARDLLEEFDRLQAEQIGRVHGADGLPLQRITVRSAFDARVKYNLYACLTILPRHQHRHIWQAERVWLASRRPRDRG